MVFIKHSEVLDGRVAIVEIQGPLNSETSPDFEDYIIQLLNKAMPFILLDATNLSYVSSEGIGLILFIQKKISENNGFFIIFNLSSEIYSLYTILGFDKVFKIAGSRIEAMQIMDKQMELRRDAKNQDPAGAPFAAGSAKQEVPSGGIHTIHPELQSKDSRTQGADKRAVSFEPFVVECPVCKSLVRIKNSGDFLCPGCNKEFTVRQDRSLLFHV